MRKSGQLLQAANMRRSSGQAIVEFLVSCLVMIPLFLLIPLLGKYIDMKQTTIAASRKLAFECTVRYDDCADLSANASFADEIRTRFFAGTDQELVSNDKPSDDVAVAAETNPFWTDRKGAALLEKFSDVGVKADAKDLTLGGSSAVGILGFAPEQFGLDLKKGLFDARVQVQIAGGQTATDFMSQLDSLKVKMQFHTTVLTNSWAAKGPGSRADQCNPQSATVVGRSSVASLCLPGMALLDSTAYAPATDVMIPLVDFIGESNAGNFQFHDFMNQGFVDRVPMGNDSSGYKRGR